MEILGACLCGTKTGTLRECQVESYLYPVLTLQFLAVVDLGCSLVLHVEARTWCFFAGKHEREPKRGVKDRWFDNIEVAPRGLISINTRIYY